MSSAETLSNARIRGVSAFCNRSIPLYSALIKFVCVDDWICYAGNEGIGRRANKAAWIHRFNIR
jgi:hypothetical protein